MCIFISMHLNKKPGGKTRIIKINRYCIVIADLGCCIVLVLVTKYLYCSYVVLGPLRLKDIELVEFVDICSQKKNNIFQSGNEIILISHYQESILVHLK